MVEGPVVDAAGALYFTDVPGGGVHRLDPGGEVQVVIPRRRGVGGLCRHETGGLLVSGRDVAHVRDGVGRVLLDRADLPEVHGVAVGGFNDLCADPSGRVLVGPTRRIPPDPGSKAARSGRMAAGEHVPSELVLITAARRHVVLYDDVAGVSNGIAVWPDGARMVHAESGGRRLRVSRFVGAERVEPVSFWDTAPITDGTPDGVAIDEEDHVWAAVFGGGCVLRFDPDGRVVDRVDVPSSLVTNVCFGGADGTDLYVTTGDNTDDPALGGCVFRLPGVVRGAPVPAARI
ncbi:SMP-30/gluconolactonase/LRE family protein [Pseudonocardia sp. GCM10023141]|uniref:SMP-30/gluconolactonase/LRE family protein n=1 Tax=Pseudonocardia sp. GCM10023141 TaxID=3252653 RepID=UPI003615F3DD